MHHPGEPGNNGNDIFFFLYNVLIFGAKERKRRRKKKKRADNALARILILIALRSGYFSMTFHEFHSSMRLLLRFIFGSLLLRLSRATRSMKLYNFEMESIKFSYITERCNKNKTISLYRDIHSNQFQIEFESIGINFRY